MSKLKIKFPRIDWRYPWQWGQLDHSHGHSMSKRNNWYISFWLGWWLIVLIIQDGKITAHEIFFQPGP